MEEFYFLKLSTFSQIRNLFTGVLEFQLHDLSIMKLVVHNYFNHRNLISIKRSTKTGIKMHNEFKLCILKNHPPHPLVEVVSWKF